MIPYVISSFRGGFSDETDKGVAGSFKHGHALDIHGRDDILTAKQAMATILDATTGVFASAVGAYSVTGTTITAPINVFVNGSDGTTYCFGSTGSIFTRSGDGFWTFAYNDENGGIKGASEWKLSDGVNYLYWSTGTSIGRKVLQGADITPDSGTGRWTDVVADYKTTLDSADWHMMIPASGSLMVGNSNALAEIKFNGDFNATALNVRPGNIVKCLEERDDYVILGTGKQGQAEEGHIWSWITTAINWVQKKRIPVKGVNSLVSAELMVLQGGDDGELFFSDFVNATPLNGLPGGGQTNPGGAAIEDDQAVFGFFGGTYPGIWSYGRKRKNRPFALNLPYRMAKTVVGSTLSTISAVTVADGVLMASWGTTDGSTNEYGIDSVSSTTKATALYEGLEFDGNQPHLDKKFDTVKVNFAPLVSGTSISVKFKLDKATTGGDSSAGAGWKYAITGGNSTSHSVADSTEAIFVVSGAAKIYEVGVELNPSSNDSPQIQSVVTYVSQTPYEY